MVMDKQVRAYDPARDYNDCWRCRRDWPTEALTVDGLCPDCDRDEPRAVATSDSPPAAPGRGPAERPARPVAHELVLGEFVQVKPGMFLRAAEVICVTEAERGTVVDVRGVDDAILTELAARQLVTALNLALERGREHLVYHPED